MLGPSDAGFWHDWTFPFELERPKRAASQYNFTLINCGCKFADEGNLAEAREAFLKARGSAQGARDVDSIYVHAEALIRLGDLDRAANPPSSRSFYRSARALCEQVSEHNAALVRQRLATLYEEEGNEHVEDAYKEYHASIAVWQKLINRNGELGNRKRHRGYREHIAALERRIAELAPRVAARRQDETAADQDRPADEQRPAGEEPAAEKAPRSAGPVDAPPPTPAPAAEQTLAAPDAPPPAPVEPNPIIDITTWLAAIPVYGDIAAGSGVWNSDDEHGDSFAEVPILRIEGKSYRPVNLAGEGAEIRLTRGYLYGLAKVRGNSMNLRGLENDDYVLFRKSRDTPYCPEEGHLVAASILKLDGRYGVVKRYHVDPEQGPVLQSMSTEVWENIPYDQSNVDPVGQVIAVFKPVT